MVVLLDLLGALTAPCLCDGCGCCDATDAVKTRSGPALRTLRTPGCEVELAVSALGGLGGFAGYHTSVLVAGEEYYFCHGGICCNSKVVSHEDRQKVRRIFIGLSQRTGSDLIRFLSAHFRPHSYDLLRKNCNSFTDCALFYLCEQRLDAGFRVMEQLGRVADEHTGLVQRASMGDYCPNRRAADFNVEDVILAIESAGSQGWAPEEEERDDVSSEICFAPERTGACDVAETLPHPEGAGLRRKVGRGRTPRESRSAGGA